MCVKWMMSCTLRSDIIWLSPKLKNGLQYCLCVLMAVTLESFLQFYFFLLPRYYLAMRVKAWNYKLQIALQNLKLTVYQQHEISIESWCEIKWFIGFFIDIGLLLLRSFLRNVDIMDRQFPVCLGYYFTNVKWLYFWFLLFTVIEN